MEVDFLIVGQGLAGSTLALALLKRGARVLVVDRRDEGSASRVAAGLITPLTGKGINPAWRQDEYLPLAESFYRDFEQETGQKFYHSAEVIRLLNSEKERDKWRDKITTHSEWGEEVKLSDDHIQAGFGGVKMAGGAWLDTRNFLKTVKTALESQDSYLEASFNEENVIFHDQRLTWNGITAKKIILCQGAYGLGHGGWFGELPHRSAKGEILTLEIENLPADVRYHANGWLAARGEKLWKAGATYDWKNLNSEPTEDGRDEILEKLSVWCKVSMKVVGHEAGVRPIIRNSRPVIGLHPEYQEIGFFNGLGSKGSLMAPGIAAHFSDFLTDRCELDPELLFEFPDDGKPEKVATGNLIKKAHQIISESVQVGDTVIDATVGNGHDTLFLASQVGVKGQVAGFDVQEQAIASTKYRLKEVGVAEMGVTLYHRSHSEMLKSLGEELVGKIACVMFNLGYLPGADKSLITQVASTLDAIDQSVELLRVGGVLTVMCYPGHPGGQDEAEKVNEWLKSLPQEHFEVTHYQRENHQSSAPFLLVVTKK